ncbi:MAG: glycoside hydrolase family 2 protein, partial [Ktedonobacteraceae bacterium]|nr:glycoside hydrolase family 2 protein [Ktedonobacteraceae bacterium]
MRHTNARKINDQWRFRLGELLPADLISTPEAAWSLVTLPHTWNALDTMETEPTHHYARTVSWYTRKLEPPSPGQRLWLEVEAASQRASIWCNGIHRGDHAGGYTAFTVELPPLNQNHTSQEPLMLALQVDNLPDPDLIPSDLSDFFLYGGLTRNVWCYTTGPRRIAVLRCETEVSKDVATLTIRGRLDTAPPCNLYLDAQLFSPQGELVTRLQSTASEEAFAFSPYSIQRPDLWSPDSPQLYTLEVSLRDSDDVWDSVTERIGFRFFSFPAGGPFLLNGETLCLHGTHRHEDWAGCGSAVPDELTRQEMLQMKQAGFNFVRLGHYPQAPAVLDACDELGLLVWEELPWCRGGIGGDEFRAQTLTMLNEMIEQHFNHPSVVMWGLGNELDWESEHPGSTDEQVCTFLRTLHDFSHTSDPQRLTALRRFEPGAHIVDVYAPTMWPGWYHGRYKDYETMLNAALARYPHLLHIEWGGDSHYGRHRFGEHIATKVANDSTERPGSATSPEKPLRADRNGDWSESYMLDLMEWLLQVQLRTPQLAGNAQWAFKDFGTPLRPENPLPYVNQKGLLDRAGHPKDLYYLFQSYLTREPMCYIESPTWPVRVGKQGEAQRVRVYSNCSHVSLFGNGINYGEKKRDPAAFPAAGLVWHIPFRPGRNELRAVGVSETGSQVEHTIVQEYYEGTAGAGATFRWKIEPIEGNNAHVRVTLQLVDIHGLPIVDDRRCVS